MSRLQHANSRPSTYQVWFRRSDFDKIYFVLAVAAGQKHRSLPIIVKALFLLLFIITRLLFELLWPFLLWVSCGLHMTIVTCGNSTMLVIFDGFIQSIYNSTLSNCTHAHISKEPRGKFLRTAFDINIVYILDYCSKDLILVASAILGIVALRWLIIVYFFMLRHLISNLMAIF